MTFVGVLLTIVAVIAVLAFAAGSTLLLGGVYKSESIKDVVKLDYADMITYGALTTVAAGATAVIVLGLRAAKVV